VKELLKLLSVFVLSSTTALAQATAPAAPPDAAAAPPASPTTPVTPPGPTAAPTPPPAPAPSPAPTPMPEATPAPTAPSPHTPLELPQPLGVVNQPAAPPQTQVTAVGEQPAPNPLPLTVATAIRMALSEGTQARLARTGEERARIGRQEALDAMLPQASANLMQYNQSINLETFGFSLPGQPPVVGPFDVTDAQITAAIQLLNLAAWRGYQARTAGVKASRFEVERAENDIASAVARLYLLVARADAQVTSRDADVRLFTELARVASDQLQAGTGTRLDVAQSNVQLARAQQSLLQARNDRETARLALLNAIGADPRSEIELRDTLQTPPPPPTDLGAAVAAARQHRPEIQGLEIAERAAELTYEAQRLRRLPNVGLEFTGDYSGNRPGDLLWTRRIAAVAGVPIFRGEIETAIARARVDVEDAKTRRAAAERDVEEQVRSTALGLANADARVQVAAQTVKVAEDALSIARERRASGYGSAVEVDRAEDVYRQAHEDLIAAQADASMAWYQLQHATGDIRSLFAEPSH